MVAGGRLGGAHEPGERQRSPDWRIIAPGDGFVIVVQAVFRWEDGWNEQA